LALLRPGDWRAAAADPRWTGGGLEFPDASEALVWLEAERANLVAAIPQIGALAPVIPAALACQLTQALFGFFLIRGYWQDGLQANHTALELARRIQDRAAQAHAHNNLGIFYFLLARYQEALACYQDSRTIFRELGDRPGEASSLGNLGAVYERLGRYEEAIACQRDSLTIFRELGDRRGEAEALRDRGDALRATGRNSEAEAGWREALTICEALGIPEADEIRDRLVTLPSQIAD
jgi:tetratricopeptide (TPR) repeat protein